MLLFRANKLADTLVMGTILKLISSQEQSAPIHGTLSWGNVNQN